MKMINEFVEICKIHKQSSLKAKLKQFMQGYDYALYDENGFLYCEPKADADGICFTAHMDTVHPEAVKRVQIEKHSVGKTVLSSPQGIGGDDRCGIFMIMQLVKSGYKPHIVFCEDEEIGCVGARKFARTNYPLNISAECCFIVELDRRNATDAVYYDLDNEEFEQYITEVTGYKTATGSYSDICEIAPAAGIAAVNLSCGYYNEHHLDHYVIWEEMMNTLQKAKQLCKAANKDRKKFEYVEKSWYTNTLGKGEAYYDYIPCTEEGWEFYFSYEGKPQVEFVSGCGFYECLGQLCEMYPALAYQDIDEFDQVY